MFQFFQLRAHIYQARSLIGLDNSGLSDPFAKIFVADCSRTTQVEREHHFNTDKIPGPWTDSKALLSRLLTWVLIDQVIDETLSPTWDELLVFGKLLVYGRKEDIKRRPPLVTVEIYDYDKVSQWQCPTPCLRTVMACSENIWEICIKCRITFSLTKQSLLDERLRNPWYI